MYLKLSWRSCVISVLQKCLKASNWVHGFKLTLSGDHLFAQGFQSWVSISSFGLRSLKDLKGFCLGWGALFDWYQWKWSTWTTAVISALVCVCVSWFAFQLGQPGELPTWGRSGRRDASIWYPNALDQFVQSVALCSTLAGWMCFSFLPEAASPACYVLRCVSLSGRN